MTRPELDAAASISLLSRSKITRVRESNVVSGSRSESTSNRWAASNSKVQVRSATSPLEKEAKLAAKTAKVTANTTVGEKKAKAEKEKQAEAAFVNTTPPGEKKGEF